MACSSPLACMIFKPQDFDVQATFPGVKAGQVPIFPVSGTAEKRHHKLEYQDSVSRSQVPISCAFAVTDYKSQGSTYESCCLDLHGMITGTEHDRWTSVNVQLGRVKTLKGVWLREAITMADVSYQPKPDLGIEISRLEALEEETLLVWQAEF